MLRNVGLYSSMNLQVKKTYAELNIAGRDTPLDSNKIAHKLFDEKPELRKKG